MSIIQLIQLATIMNVTSASFLNGIVLTLIFSVIVAAIALGVEITL